MAYNGFNIDEGSFHISHEQMAKIAKDLQDNSPMHDINKHYNEELRLLNAMMEEMKKQAKDSDNKHYQAMTKANWQIFWAVAAVIIAVFALILNMFPEIGASIKESLYSVII